jgi:glucan phosphoethanolaminetransferase (alkaline phosphatase superfamily)
MDKLINFKWIHAISIVVILICQLAIVLDFAITFTEHISFLTGKLIALLIAIVFCLFSYIEFASMIKTKMNWVLKVFVIILIVIGVLMMFYFVPQLLNEQSKVLI